LAVSGLRLAGNATGAAAFLPGVFALAGSLVGLALVIFVLERKKGYWPALPPIVFGALAGLAAYWLAFA
jgi:presenilin-like A22 family membrane protease